MQAPQRMQLSAAAVRLAAPAGCSGRCPPARCAARRRAAARGSAMVYVVIGWPVPLRARSRRKTPRSAARGMSFSIPIEAMCMGGSAMPRSALPSLVHTTKPPVSAMAKFTPVSPACAARNFSRRCCARGLGQLLRIGEPGSACRASRWKSSPISSFFRWMAGMTMWLGGSLAELHDALAEVGVDDLDARALRDTVEVALLGEHRLALHQPGDAPRPGGSRGRWRCARRRRAAQCTCAPSARALALELLEVLGEPRERVELDPRGGVAERLPVGHGRRGAVALRPHEPERLVVPVGALVVEDEGPRLLRVEVDHRDSRAFSSISATCTTGSFVPSRRASASRCIRQDMS